MWSRDGRQPNSSTKTHRRNIEDELSRIVNAGKRAYEQLLLRNRRLVASVALHYGKQARFLEVDDLVQEGMIGLAHAIDRFDFGTGTRLSTYAVWWIRQAITRAIADQDRTIRLPVHRIEALNSYRRAVADLERRSNRAPSDVEIAGAMKLLSPAVLVTIKRAQSHDEALHCEVQQQVDRAVKHVQYLRQLADMNLVSLDMPVGAQDESTVLGDFLPDRAFPSPEQAALTSSLREQLDSVLDGLGDRERCVLIRRYGLGDDSPETLEEIGQRLNVTRERVRQIEAKTLRKLRHPVRSRLLRDYIEFTPNAPEE